MYALDFCGGGECKQDGRVALAPTDIIYEHTATNRTDYHFFEVRTSKNTSAVKLCMSLGHFDFDDPPNAGRRFEQGQRLGLLTPYGGVPHNHMGMWITEKGNSCAAGGTALTFLDDFTNSDTRIENVPYLSSVNGNTLNVHANTWAVSSLVEVLTCTANGNGEFPATASGCTCPPPTLTSPINNATLTSNTITFRWNAVAGCQYEGYRFRICLTSPVSDPTDCFRDDYVDSTEWRVTISNRDRIQLFWGVRAENSANGAAWSEQSFRIDPEGSGGEGDTCQSNEEPDDDEVILFDERIGERDRVRGCTLAIMMI